MGAASLERGVGVWAWAARPDTEVGAGEITWLDCEDAEADVPLDPTKISAINANVKMLNAK